MKINIDNGFVGDINFNNDHRFVYSGELLQQIVKGKVCCDCSRYMNHRNQRCELKSAKVLVDGNTVMLSDIPFNSKFTYSIKFVNKVDDRLTIQVYNGQAPDDITPLLDLIFDFSQVKVINPLPPVVSFGKYLRTISVADLMTALSKLYPTRALRDDYICYHTKIIDEKYWQYLTDGCYDPIDSPIMMIIRTANRKYSLMPTDAVGSIFGLYLYNPDTDIAALIEFSSTAPNIVESAVIDTSDNFAAEQMMAMATTLANWQKDN